MDLPIHPLTFEVGGVPTLVAGRMPQFIGVSRFSSMLISATVTLPSNSGARWLPRSTL
jgi:hypothetical protein